MIKINKKIIFSEKKPPVLIAEISANHCGSKNLFLKHIKEAAKSGADMIKIQTYEPVDITVNSSKKYLKLKVVFGKEKVTGIYIKMPAHHLLGTRMHFD